MNERLYAYSEQIVPAAQTGIDRPLSLRQGQLQAVDSLLHPMAVLIRRVLTRAGRQELDLILIDDEVNIVQALDAGVQFHSLYHAGDESFSPGLMHRLPPNILVCEVAKRTCKKLFENDRVSRVFGIAHTPAALGLDRLPGISGDIVALEDMTISGNIGAIVRTAVAFGIGAVVLLNADPVDIYDRRLIRASRGYIFALPVITATTEELTHFCRQHDLPLLVTSAQGERLMDEAVSLYKRLVIVFGSEKDGCSQHLLDAAALQVQIPTHASVESLNVSTVAGIMLYNRLWFNQPRARK